ncbi:LemA family protein [Flavobacterium chungangense]|uniref:LemA family protein n=1 Tax=Flavobacterium chungangense TaxID=554283 RepID=A0A6V6YSC2_9FLAO|nr:LemA family protein [Flavobacterium chungangense]CAD0002360.1 LemA family protein [Flavobacterium chungangense]
MIVILGLIIFLLIVGIAIYNSLIAKRNQASNAFSAIDVMLKKRFDLIPNLVEVIKQYANYEQGTLTKIAELRAKATSGTLKDSEKASLDTELSTAVKGLMVTVENYPDLKANTNFLNLQTTWTESEEQIAAARRTYNAIVTDYNNTIMMFPGNIFAGILGFTKTDVLATPEEERKNISAKELFNN